MKLPFCGILSGANTLMVTAPLYAAASPPSRASMRQFQIFYCCFVFSRQEAYSWVWQAASVAMPFHVVVLLQSLSTPNLADV